MKVALIASTIFSYATGPAAMRSAGYVFHQGEPATDGWGPKDADELAEFAGRLCYKSWNRPNPATAHNEGYLGNIIDHEHFSVLEHASATFYISGVSRSLTHELVRHRHLSYSQVSQRYVDESDSKIVVPPALRDTDPALLDKVQAEAKSTYKAIVQLLTEKGLDRKEARQAARAVLLNATETALVVTGNMRAWREVISKRNTEYADAEIRELAAELLRQLKTVAPNSFQDMEVQ